MTSIATVTVEVEVRRYMLIFFPIATFQRVDDVSKLTVFGVPVFKRIGNAKWLFGYVYN